MLAATADVSSRPTPRKIKRPVVIFPVAPPSTVTLARLTRWTTARILRGFSAVSPPDATRPCAAHRARRWSPTHDRRCDLLSVFLLPHPQQQLGWRPETALPSKIR